jgi:S-adenosylmethionine hydrolase
LSIITITTDFGLKDGNVGVMKGVIWGIAPDTQFADISHMISPQNVLEGALILARSIFYYPPGSIHLAVVDPGVGTTRRPIAARLGAQRFVGPDNGLITQILERAENELWPVEIIHLDKPQYRLPEVSHVFHGRDIFAPAAGYLAAGVSLEMLGTPISDPVRLRLPIPEPTEHGLRGEVIHIDHFGNISTNIRYERLGEVDGATIKLCGVAITGLMKTFGERPVGELIALYGSTGNLLVSVVNGSAAQRLGAKIGDPVEVEL